MENTRAHPLLETRDATLDFARALITTFALGAGAYLIARLWGVAATLKLDYFDAYQNFLNARALVDRSAAFYNPYRPVGVALLYLPCHLADRMAWASCHELSVALYAALGVTSFQLFRRAASLPFAAVATMILLWNPLALHYAAFGKEDLPATLFVTASLFFHRRNILAELAFVTAAVSLRYPLVAFLPVMYAADYAVRRERRSAILSLVVPPLAVLAISAAVYATIGRPPLSLVKEVFEIYGYNAANAARPPSLAWFFTFRLIGPVLLVAAAIGARRDKFLLLFVAGYLLIHAYVVPGKEARYFLPLLPPILYFAAAGAETLWLALPRVARLYLLAVVALPLSLGATELSRFDDPVYTDDFVDRVATALEARSPAGNLYWIGPYYPLHPKNFVDTPLDDYTHLHHISADALIWRTNRPVRGLPVDAVSRVVRDGDAVVVNHEPDGYVTRTLPTRKLRPVVVEAVLGGHFTDAIVIAPRD